MVKRQLQKRAVKTLMGLGQHFRKIDLSGDGLLDQHELKRALQSYHITIPEEVCTIVTFFPNSFPVKSITVLSKMSIGLSGN